MLHCGPGVWWFDRVLLVGVVGLLPQSFVVVEISPGVRAVSVRVAAVMVGSVVVVVVLLEVIDVRGLMGVWR